MRTSPTTKTPDSRRASRRRPARDGGLLVDKPAGITSHDVVQRVRKLLDERRLGHTGTLDPFATGLLVLCLGRGTRLARFISGTSKSYLAGLRFGYATDTYDSTGTPTSPERDDFPTEDALEEALRDFRGVQKQVPPPYSAKKVNGKRAHRLARAGRAVLPEPVEVEVQELRLLELAPPRARIEVTVSSGTYVRSLAHDLGQRLGCGAHLDELRRLRVGPFSVEEASSLETLEGQAAAGSVAPSILSPSEMLRDLPELTVGPEEVWRLVHGLALEAGSLEIPRRERQFLQVRDAAGDLVAVAQWNEGLSALRPVVVLQGDSEEEPQGS